MGFAETPLRHVGTRLNRPNPTEGTISFHSSDRIFLSIFAKDWFCLYSEQLVATRNTPAVEARVQRQASWRCFTLRY